MTQPAPIGANPRPPARRRGGVIVKVVVALVALAAVGGGAAALLSGGGDAKAKQATTELFAAQTMSFDIAISANGELEARQQKEYRSQLDKQAQIVEIIAEGMRVKPGDLLVRLASDEIQQQLDEEAPRVRTAESDVVAAEAGYEIQINENNAAKQKAEVALRLAEIEHQKWLKGDDDLKQQGLQLAIEKAEREAERLGEKFERAKRLYEQQFLSEDELKRDETAALEAQANLISARLEKKVYMDFERAKQETTLLSDIEQARAEVERVESKNSSQLAQKAAERDNKRDQLTLRRKKFADLQKQMAATEIRADQEGLVVYGSTTERSRWGGMNDGGLQIGQQVSPNELLIVLPDTREMVASVRVHEANAGRVRPGMKASLKVDAAQGKVFTGQVTSIGVLAESGGWRDPNLREYTVKIALDPAEDTAPLKPSMRCEATLQLGKVENVLAIPVQAVFNEGQVRYVFTPQGGKFERVPIKIGRRSDLYAEVRAGLTEGAKVLVRRPEPQEVRAGEFSKEQLAALDAAAPDPVRGGRGRPGMAGAAPGGAPAAAAQPEAPAQPAQAQPAPADATAVVKTADEKKQ